MSFLLPSDTKTLTEALAFVDAFAASGDSAGRERSGEVSAEREVVVDKHERAKAKRKSAWYSARLRARKKNKLLQLQEQVASLEMQLERLQSERSSAVGSKHRMATPVDNRKHTSLQTCDSTWPGASTDKASCWLQKAAEEALRRQTAERVNTQLKTLLRRVMENFTVLHGVFGNLHSLSSDFSPVGCCPSSSPMGLPMSENAASPQLDNLREHLDSMHSDTHLVLASIAAAPENYESSVKHNPRSGGLSLQLSSSTPIACDLDSASRIFWTGMQLKHYDRCYKERLQRLQPSVNSVVKSYVVRVCDGAGERTLHGVTYARKLEERDRIVYMWASATVPSDKESIDSKSCDLHSRLCFREKGWAMLSRAPDDPEHQSVFQTSYEVSGEPSDAEAGKFLSMKNSGRLCRSVVDVLSGTLRTFHEQLQDPSGPVASRIGR
ncbi:uncharacterized protein IUM83_18528 [Phytophthora cinnamomi]|uniref:uncharacterized protein n=1 Tax=Phytophthora cinnamomi TaxID=4785 RepID=UPI00355A4548|nr:hypothetical protein IUM83_18528 [Phytophthora cinnamomi]